MLILSYLVLLTVCLYWESLCLPSCFSTSHKHMKSGLNSGKFLIFGIKKRKVCRNPKIWKYFISFLVKNCMYKSILYINNVCFFYYVFFLCLFSEMTSQTWLVQNINTFLFLTAFFSWIWPFCATEVLQRYLTTEEMSFLLSPCTYCRPCELWMKFVNVPQIFLFVCFCQQLKCWNTFVFPYPNDNHRIMFHRD